MSRKSPKKYKIYKYNYTCNRLPKKNLLKKSSEIDFSSGDILTSKKSRFQRILNRVRGKKKREISPSYFITPWFASNETTTFVGIILRNSVINWLIDVT